MRIQGVLVIRENIREYKATFIKGHFLFKIFTAMFEYENS